MRAIVIGAVESSRIAIRAISAAPGWELAAVMTLPPDLAHRHSDFVDLAPDTAQAGAHLLTAANGNAPEALAQIRALMPDVIFVIGWSQICGPQLRAIASDRVVGYHPAALPRMRGRAAMPWTILAQEPITAGTLFWIDEGVDSGPILDQQYFHVAPDETVAALYRHHMHALHIMLERSLRAMAQGQERRDVQDDRYATWAARRTAADGLVDWTRHARDIDRLIRAVGDPYPGAYTHMGNARVTLWSSQPCAEGPRHLASPGQVVAIDGDRLTVKCGGDSALHITRWTCTPDAPVRLHAMLGGSR